MEFALFQYGERKAGMVKLALPIDGLVPLSRSSKKSVVDAVYCPAHYEFSLVPENLEGHFNLTHQNDEFQIADFHIYIADRTRPATPVSAAVLTKELFVLLIETALIAGRVKAEWFPPKSTISGPGVFSAVAGEGGFIRRVRVSPTGGRGKSRKHEHSWKDSQEIMRTVGLMYKAEALFKSPEYLSMDIDLSSKAKREEWVAKQTQVWSVGTVHVQLSYARKLGLIESGRKRK